ncbi:hypothetical protein ACFLW1_01590 [Chloroflexota bacterium]
MACYTGHMKILTAYILALIILVATAPAALAEDEPARYNYATARLGSLIDVVPGETGQAAIYFYNIGNRITHVTLDVEQAPDGFQVSFDPPLHDIRVMVGDETLTVTEHVYVEPAEPAAEEMTDIPEGTVSLEVPNLGYMLAKAVYINVSVAETMPPGTSGDITIGSVARWLGQSGTVAFSQSREFVFTVRVIRGETNHTEVIIEESPPEASTSEPSAAPATGSPPVVVPTPSPQPSATPETASPPGKPAAAPPASMPETDGEPGGGIPGWAVAIICVAVAGLTAFLLLRLGIGKGKPKAR